MNATTPKILLPVAECKDCERSCAIKLAEIEQTSAMDLERLQQLATLASYFKVVCCDGVVSGFLLAMDYRASYANKNFEWFAKKYATFLYIDRVVIDS